MPQILPLADLRHADRRRAGGKAVNLGELLAAGQPVPPGSCILTSAYEAFVAGNDLHSEIQHQTTTLDPADPDALEAASAAIRARFEAGPIPPEVAADIHEAYQALSLDSPGSTPAVAVRSSATAEDLPGLSFAGQQDTYLNVVGEAALLQAVKHCWASLWTARAIGYRARNNISPDDLALAVVVQRMVAAQASGVLFTANPVSGRRDEMVIDASFGLGEAVVQGIVDPDHYVVDSRTWTISGRKLGAKALAILAQSEGGTAEVRQEQAAAQQALPDAQIIALCQTAARIAGHFGSPQDIEWAWAEDKLFILQSRPITSLYPVPDVPVPAGALGFYFSFAAIQGINDPITPLGRDVLRLGVGGVLLRVAEMKVDLVDTFPYAGERIFLNFTNAVPDPQFRRLLLALFARGDPPAKQIMLRLIADGRLPLEEQRRHGPPRVLFHLLPKVMPRLLQALASPQAALAGGQASAERFLAQVREHDRQARAGGMNLAGRLALMRSDLGSLAEQALLPIFPAVFPAIAMLTVVNNWLMEWCGAPPGSGFAIMRGAPGNVTTEMDLKLWAAAQAIRADAPSYEAIVSQPVPDLLQTYRDGALSPVASRELQGFLAEYGMRAVAEIDFARPRWRDDPSSVLQTLKSYLQITDPASAPNAVFQRNAAEAERLAAQYVAQTRARRGRFRARMLGFVISRMRALGGAREMPKLYIIKLLDIYRSLLLDSAARLVAEGCLDRAEDIFLVPLDTLTHFAGGEAIDLKAVVAEKRAAYTSEMARRQIPHIILSTGEAFYEGISDSAAGANNLAGAGVSPGVVEGPVHVVLDPRGAHLTPGEILVCPATDPGWTTLFLAAGGLVMEMGGMVTHGAVVAREYGIPAVVGVERATERLKTGDRVRVDGGSGIVEILEAITSA